MISHTHKFIFIHIPKTGGTSIEKVLSRYQTNNESRVHIPLGYYDNSLYRDYYKFVFVRNPWEKLVSQYFFTQKLKEKRGLPPYNKSFKEFILEITGWSKEFVNLKNYKPWKSPWQLPWIYDNSNNVAIDFIGRFENLQQDFDHITSELNIPKKKLPRKNKSKHKHYTEYYDDETRQIVAEKYAKDIEYFGYEFGE